MCDHGAVLTYFENIFGDKIEHEVIKMVLQSCDWNHDIAKEKLQLLCPSANDKNLNKIPNTINLNKHIPIDETLLSDKLKNVNLNEDKNNEHIKPNNHICTILKSDNKIKGNKLDNIKKIINRGQPKVLIIMRGLPGSGKTTCARLLIEGTNGIILSTDDYFSDKFGNYNFNPANLPEAHDWNKKRATTNIINNVTPIFIDNTNLQLWEFEPYIKLAINNDYLIELIEPETFWKYNCQVLGKKNIHDISRDKIELMLDRFEKNLTLEKIINRFPHYLKSKYKYLNYDINTVEFIHKNNHKEDQSSLPLIDNELTNHSANIFKVETFKDNSFTDEINTTGNEIDSDISENLFCDIVGTLGDSVKKALDNKMSLRDVNKSQSDMDDLAMYNLLSNLKENSIEPLTNSSPNSYCIDRKKDELIDSNLKKDGLIDSNFKKDELIDSNLKKERYSNSFEIIDSIKKTVNKTKDFEWNCIDSDSVLSSWLTDSNEQKAIIQSQSTNKRERTINGDPNRWLNVDFGPKRNNDESGLNWNSGDKNFLESWEVINHDNDGHSPYTGAIPKHSRKLNIKSQSNKVDNYTQVNYCDLIKQQNANVKDLKILYGNGERFVPADLDTSSSYAIKCKLYLDKGSMTEDLFEQKKYDIHSISKILSLFPNIARENAKELLSMCKYDVDWVVNILIDGGYEIADLTNSEDIVYSSDSSDLEENECLNISCEGNKTDESQDPALSDNSNIISEKLKPNLEEHMEVKKLMENVFSSSYISESKIKKEKSQHVQPSLSPSLEIKKEKSQHVQPSLSPSLEDTTENGLAGDNKVAPQYLTLELDTEFAAQLINLFGNISSLGITSNFTREDRHIVLPFELCSQIHKCWAKTLEGNLQNEVNILDRFIKDEELARKLQEEENKTLMTDAFHSDPPKTLKEIIDLEKALELSISNKSEDGSSYSHILQLRKLQEDYSHVESSTVDRIYRDCDYKYEDAKCILAFQYGNVKSSKAEDEDAHTNSEEKDELCEEEIIAAKNPQIYRDEAQMHYQERKKALAKAQEASRQGMKAVAAFYAQIGNQHYVKLKEANERASKMILQAVNSNKDNDTLDLHLLTVSEALQALQSFLLEKKSALANKQLQNNKLSVITGRGNHSLHGEAKLKPAIEYFLRKEKYNFHFVNDGMLIINLR